jgi:hypothetical protein
MNARPIPETVARFRRAARERNIPAQYGILEGLASCVILNGEVNEWAAMTLLECARIGERHRNNGSGLRSH